MTKNRNKSKTSTISPKESAEDANDTRKNETLASEVFEKHLTAKQYVNPQKIMYADLLKTSNSLTDYIVPPSHFFEYAKNTPPSQLTTSLADYLSGNRIRADEEVIELKKSLKEAQAQLNEAEGSKEDVIRLYEELQQKERNAHVIRRIHSDAVDKYLSDGNFRDQFKHRSETDAIVVSIDIRRSTDLMLKARKADLYSDFITELSGALSNVIISNFGIFDKFTGDGVLAFFPEFYSGKHAILFALKAAQECHEVFRKHYKTSKDKFSVFIQDVGLGIGIDYGLVTLVNTGAELTVVGRPVVYACRFGGAKAGETLMNIEAYEMLETKRPTPLVRDVIESEIHIKNEGNALAYQPIINLTTQYELQSPNWLKAED